MNYIEKKVHEFEDKTKSNKNFSIIASDESYSQKGLESIVIMEVFLMQKISLPYISSKRDQKKKGWLFSTLPEVSPHHNYL